LKVIYNKVIEILEYNSNGAQSKSIDALGNVTQYFYDKNKRLLKTIDPEGYIVEDAYDETGNKTSRIDGRGNKTTYEYDEFNRLKKVTGENNEITEYAYDLNGNMISLKDGKGNLQLFEYNAANKMVRRIDAGGRTGTAGSYSYNPAKTESYTYYGNGKLKTKVDRNGVTSSYVYDIHGRILAETIGSITKSYTYDSNGNQLTMTDSTGTTVRTYDEENRVTSKEVPYIGKAVYVYDIIEGMDEGCTGERSVDPKGNITLKIYDRAGRIHKVVVEGKISTYSYYDNGALRSIAYPEGHSEEYTYYKNRLLDTLTNRKADGTVLESYKYNYDAAKNMISKVDVKGTTGYEYDSLNRLKKVTEPNGTVTTYTFDGAGNRETENVVSGGNTRVTTYIYNEQNRLIKTETKLNGIVIEVTNFTYDNNGSQLTSTQTFYENGAVLSSQVTENRYNELNQLIEAITPDGNNIVHIYNGEGIRVAKAVNGVIRRYFYEGDKVVLEVDDNGRQIARNVYGINLLTRFVDGQTVYYMYNGHGDVTKLINPAGNQLASYYYDAFGKITEETGTIDNPFRYAGYQYDKETKTYYLMARMYDPEAARFLQEDSYRGVIKDPLSLNLYTYSHNNPIVYGDPSGYSITLGGLLVAGIVGAGISAAINVGSQMLIGGKSLRDLDMQSVKMSAVEGAISGVTGVLTGGLSLKATAGKEVAKLSGKQLLKQTSKAVVFGAASGGARNAAAQKIVKGDIDKQEVISSALFSGVTAGLTFTVHNTEKGKALVSAVDRGLDKFKKGIKSLNPFAGNVKRMANEAAEGGLNSKVQIKNPKDAGLKAVNKGAADATNAATRNPIFADNNLMIAAAEKGHAGALAEIRGGKTYITPNQYNEFLNVSSSTQRNARAAFLQNEGIDVFGGKQAGNIAGTAEFQQIFQKVEPIQGRGDAALGAFAKATGYEAVTMEKRLYNLFTHTWPKLEVPIRRVK
jgi:RHS repeat-associated protein